MFWRNASTSRSVVPWANSVHGVLLPLGFRSANLNTGISPWPAFPNPKLSISLRLINLVFERPKNEERTRSSEGKRVSVCDKTEATTLYTPRPANNALNGMDKKMKKFLSQANIAFTAAKTQTGVQSRENKNLFHW